MSQRPKFSDTAIAEAFGLSRAPATFDRTGRVRLLGEYAEDVMAGRSPSRDAELFVAAAIWKWLETGGSLERDYFKVTAKAGSHHTPAEVWRMCRASPSSGGATQPVHEVTISPSSSTSECGK